MKNLATNLRYEKFRRPFIKLTVVFVTDSYPFDTLGFVVAGDIRYASVLACRLVLDLVQFSVLGVGSTVKQIRL